MENVLNKIITELNQLKTNSLAGRRGGEYRIGLTNAIQVVNGYLHEGQPETMRENSLQNHIVSGSIVFSAKTIKDGEIVTSQSIINEHGKVYLKHPIHKGHWIECYADSLITNRE